MNKKKPSVPFSKATLSDCVRPDGLALNIDYASIDAPSLHIPTSFPTPVASDLLCQNLSRIKTVWVLDNEKACRIVIGAILTEVLLSQSNEQLLGSVKSRMIGNEEVLFILAMWTVCLGPVKPNLLIPWTLFFWLWKQRKNGLPVQSPGGVIRVYFLN